MNNPSDKFIEELAKQLPVKDAYDDSVKPSAEEVGRITSDLIKVISLVLAPVQYLAALQDRYRNFIDNSVRRVPEDQRIPPAPQILGPVLEGIKYEPESTSINEMFSQLLSRAMDRERVDEAHPSFPFIIKQLSPDEAIVLSLLKGRGYLRQYIILTDAKTFETEGIEVEKDGFPKEQLQFPNNFKFYYEHLHNLGLVEISKYQPPEIIRDRGLVNIDTTRIFEMYRLTETGKRFINACT